jgi:Uma2 family endonuclease
MTQSARTRATYADVLAAPEHLVAEVIDGTLSTSPRPAPRHADAASVLGMDLGGPFHRGRGGPGGWWILFEPELHLGDEPDIVVPDLAGWRRERLGELPGEAFFTLAPDWLCEVLSPSTMQLDRVRKIPVYAKSGVSHVWLVDPLAKTLEVFTLDGDSYRLTATHADEEMVRAVPFNAIELELGALWGK